MATETEMMRIIGDRVFVAIKAVPSASKTEIVGFKDGRLRIKVAAAPEDGKANAELCRALSKVVGCPKSAVRLEAGDKSRLKTLSFPSSFKAEIERLLADGPVGRSES